MGYPAHHVEVVRHSTRVRTPAVSILTVYDRVECLKRSVRSVQELRFTDYEQIIVADRPPDAVLTKLAAIAAGCNRVTMASLKTRRNDWGITPAAAALSLAKGKYVCFLSDDNGYLSHHFDRLVEALEEDPDLGFAYSLCLYDGRRTLRAPRPEPGEIDLGQPLFRRELFDRSLEDTAPFHQFGWDWRTIERLMQRAFDGSISMILHSFSGWRSISRMV